MQSSCSSCHPSRELTPTNWPGLISRPASPRPPPATKDELKAMVERVMHSTGCRRCPKSLLASFMRPLVRMPRCEALLTQGLVSALSRRLPQLETNKWEDTGRARQ